MGWAQARAVYAPVRRHQLPRAVVEQMAPRPELAVATSTHPSSFRSASATPGPITLGRSIQVGFGTTRSLRPRDCPHQGACLTGLLHRRGRRPRGRPRHRQPAHGHDGDKTPRRALPNTTTSPARGHRPAAGCHDVQHDGLECLVGREPEHHLGGRARPRWPRPACGRRPVDVGEAELPTRCP